MAFRKQRVGIKKVCYFTKNKITYIDYKDVELLKKFISANGKITPRRVTGTSANIKGCWQLLLKEHAKWHYYLIFKTNLISLHHLMEALCF